ncbi:MAG: outer membrane protein assembly factor BamE [Arsenophonus sp. ET-DL12-MAG3]
MYYKFLIFVIIFFVILTMSCSILERFVYHPNINQGNYLSTTDIKKIKKGMTQNEIIYILGTPMIKEPFGQKVWHYVFRQQFSYKKIKQKTLTLFFDSNNVCIDIKLTMI